MLSWDVLQAAITNEICEIVAGASSVGDKGASSKVRPPPFHTSHASRLPPPMRPLTDGFTCNV